MDGGLMRTLLIAGLNIVFALFYAAIFVFIYAAFHQKGGDTNEET